MTSATTVKVKGYKEDQGRLARMAAFWGVTLLVLFGCNFLFQLMLEFEAMARPLGGIQIPVVSVDLSPAFLISSLIFLAGVVVVRGWQQKPKVADLLIDTESELRKVTWPSSQEVINSSLVVIVSVLLIGGFLAFVDVVLARVMKNLLLGG